MTQADRLAESGRRMARGIMRLRNVMCPDPVLKEYTDSYWPWSFEAFMQFCDDTEWELGEEA